MEEKDFIINVGPNGTFRPSGQYQTLPEHIDGIFDRFEAQKPKEIALFFHGGLNNERVGMATAHKMGKHISDAGQMPLCFVWETGLIETVTTNIGKITETELFNKLLRILLKKVAEKLGFNLIEGRGGTTTMTDAEIEAELFKEHPFESYTQQKLNANGRGDAAIAMLPSNEDDLLRLLEAELTYSVQSDYELTVLVSETRLTVDTGAQGQTRGIISTAMLIKHIAIIAFRIIRRFINKRDHDLYPTVIEEILRELYIAELGAWVWNNMKVKSRDMWKNNQNRQGLNRFAGRYLLEKLLAHTQKYPDTKVNLIGHSAGSIAICNLLSATSSISPDFSYNKVVFLAPACRVDLFNQEVVLNEKRLKKFRMYTMNDNYEKLDRLVPYFYTHSLLYLISGILEDEGKEFDGYILGMERYFSSLKPYDIAEELITTRKFLYRNSSNHVVFSKTTPGGSDGIRTNSETHGGFDDDKDTIESIKHFLSKE